MASAVITLGYSVSGGFQAGNNKIVTIGFESQLVTTAECIAVKATSFGVASGIGMASFNRVIAKTGIAKSEGSICG